MKLIIQIIKKLKMNLQFIGSIIKQTKTNLFMHKQSVILRIKRLQTVVKKKIIFIQDKILYLRVKKRIIFAKIRTHNIITRNWKKIVGLPILYVLYLYFYIDFLIILAALKNYFWPRRPRRPPRTKDD